MHTYIIHACIHTFIHSYIHAYLHTYPHTCFNTMLPSVLHSICSGGVRWLASAYVAGGFAEDWKEWIHRLLPWGPFVQPTPKCDPGEGRWHVWDRSWEWQPPSVACYSNLPQAAQGSQLCFAFYCWQLGTVCSPMRFLKWKLVGHLFKRYFYYIPPVWNMFVFWVSPVPLLCLPTQVWRLRKYPQEKVIAAAKPLWFLPGELKLEKGAAKRVV